MAGEDSRQAAHRELFEELGIDADFSGLRPVFTMNFDNGFDDFYTLILDAEPEKLRLQPEEVQAVRWASREEIFSMLDDGSFIPFFRSVIDLLFDVRCSADCLNIPKQESCH